MSLEKNVRRFNYLSKIMAAMDNQPQESHHPTMNAQPSVINPILMSHKPNSVMTALRIKRGMFLLLNDISTFMSCGVIRLLNNFPNREVMRISHNPKLGGMYYDSL